jgi:S-adenosylmethionine decarboxylase
VSRPASGTEWFVDAHGCEPGKLRSRDVLEGLFSRLIRELELHPLGEGIWHAFPVPGGVTGVVILQESHLSCHTFPERGYAAFDLYCCRPRGEWPWGERLQESLGADRVLVRSVSRGEA